MAEVVIEEVETYILCRQNTVDQCTANLMILELCLAAEQRTLEWVPRWWWEQDGIELILGEGRPAEWVMETEREDDAERTRLRLHFT